MHNPSYSPNRLQLLPANALPTWIRVSPQSTQCKSKDLSLKPTLSQYSSKKSHGRALHLFAHLIPTQSVTQVHPPSSRASRTGSSSSAQRDFRRWKPRQVPCGVPGGCEFGMWLGWHVRRPGSSFRRECRMQMMFSRNNHILTAGVSVITSMWWALMFRHCPPEARVCLYSRRLGLDTRSGRASCQERWI